LVARMSANICASIYDGRNSFGSVIQRTARRVDVFDQSGCHLADYNNAADAALRNPRPATRLRDIIGLRGGGNG
jgi:hypothetical protein